MSGASGVLLARYAECLFWLGRYVERAENLARILRVNDLFARDAGGDKDWLPIVQINADDERFARRHGGASATTVLHFYVRDGDNPTSLMSAVRGARENARSLRPLISTEMWVHINTLYARVGALTDDDLAPARRVHLFDELREQCQAHAGIVEGTFHRDQGWYFYQIGRHLERADQTTRLLDIKYHRLLPRVADVGSPLDVGQWTALLRSASGYHAYLRLYAGQVTPGSVVSFLLLDQQFPRSVNLCVRTVEQLLTEVKSHYSLRGATGALEELDVMRAALGSLAVRDILRAGLHEFLDILQQQLLAIGADIGRAFFGHAPAEAPAPAPKQSQTQSLGSMTQSQSFAAPAAPG